jgi:hypothetical protein
MSEPVYRVEIYGEAKIGWILRLVKEIGEIMSFKPEDFSSPMAFQQALSRNLQSLFPKAMEIAMNPKILEEKTYVAEIKLKDVYGREVVFTIGLGDSIPPLTSEKVKTRVIIELYEEEPTAVS